MNKISAVLLSCCLAVSASFAFAGDGMSMGMEKNPSGSTMMRKDAMTPHAMNKDAMDEGMMKKETGGKRAMKPHKKHGDKMHGDKMHGDEKQGAMQRMQ